MDLSEFFSSEQPVPMQVTHPTTYEPLMHEGKPVQVMLWGPDSAVMQEAERKIANMTIARVSKQRGRSAVISDASEIEAQRKHRLMAAIDDIRNFNVEGKPLKLTDALKEEIAAGGYKWGWLREQIEGFLLDRGNFTKTASKN